MNRADEGALALALADSATASLKPADRARLCAKLVVERRLSQLVPRPRTDSSATSIVKGRR